jgi:hypothetical protein
LLWKELLLRFLRFLLLEGSKPWGRESYPSEKDILTLDELKKPPSVENIPLGQTDKTDKTSIACGTN